MNYEIISKPFMLVAGAELRTTFVNNECYVATPAFCRKLYTSNFFDTIPNKVSPALIGVYTNYSPDFSLTSGSYSLIAGCQVNNADTIPAGMVVKKIPAAKYAVFKAKGPFATAIGSTWQLSGKTKRLSVHSPLILNV